MDEMRFLLTIKLIEKYDDRISEFFSTIERYVEKLHDAEFTGIEEISSYGVSYTWQRTTGCRGHYNTENGSAHANWAAILEILLKGETK